MTGCQLDKEKKLKYLIVTACVIFLTWSFTEAKQRTCEEKLQETTIESAYCDQRGFLVYGEITYATAQLHIPEHSVGSVVWFNPNKMEETAQINGTDLTGYVDGIALMSCADVGKTVWLKREGAEWEGPYITASCAWKSHMFADICYIGEVAELGFKTAERWGLVSLEEDGGLKVLRYREDNVEVFVGNAPPSESNPVNYRKWWLEQVQFEDGTRFTDLNTSCTP